MSALLESTPDRKDFTQMGDTPIGVEPVQPTAQVTPDSQPVVSNQPAEPTVYEVDDNSLIKPKGFEKPVKYGEHVRGLQSEFTKARQQAIQFQRELEAERQQRQRLEAEYQRAQQSNEGQIDVYQALRQLPYLSGEDAATVVHSIVGQIKQRDKILLAALTELKNLKESVGGLTSNQQNTVFESKIAKFTEDAGLPVEAREWVADLYVAYEGPDLDQEFPRILQERLELLNRINETKRQEKLRQAKRSPFVPGRGGEGRPSQPLQMKGNEDPRQIADLMWEQMHGTGT